MNKRKNLYKRQNTLQYISTHKMNKGLTLKVLNVFMCEIDREREREKKIRRMFQ